MDDKKDRHFVPVNACDISAVAEVLTFALESPNLRIKYPSIPRLLKRFERYMQTEEYIKYLQEDELV